MGTLLRESKRLQLLSECGGPQAVSPRTRYGGPPWGCSCVSPSADPSAWARDPGGPLSPASCKLISGRWESGYVPGCSFFTPHTLSLLDELHLPTTAANFLLPGSPSQGRSLWRVEGLPCLLVPASSSSSVEGAGLPPAPQAPPLPAHPGPLSLSGEPLLRPGAVPAVSRMVVWAGPHCSPVPPLALVWDLLPKAWS